jgi:hypothetical protein
VRGSKKIGVQMTVCKAMRSERLRKGTELLRGSIDKDAIHVKNQQHGGCTVLLVLVGAAPVQ